MKKPLLLFIFLLLFVFNGQGQNLVPNGDFEQYTSCPTSQSQIDTALFWFGATANGTPDYYHVCCPNTWVGVPYHAAGGGYQYSLSGDAYTGIFIYRLPFSSNTREYIETPLTSTLIANKCYHFEMYVNLSNNCNYTSDDIGIYFSDTAITEYTAPVDPLLLPFTPHINNPTGILMDTLNWTLVSGNYTAQGGENFLVIGNFKHDSITTAIVVNNNISAYDYAYFYIEDVSLTPCTSIKEQNQNDEIKIYPNPVRDELTVSSKQFGEKAEIKITDATGRIVLQQTTNILQRSPYGQSSIFNIQSFQSGIYFIEINDGKNVWRKKFLKVD